MYGYIYKTTCLVNNKLYIGQHKAKKFSLTYKGSGSLIREAFNKYGKDNFKVELIEFCETAEIADNKEKYWIKHFNTTNLNIGYNILVGGQKGSFKGQHHSNEAKLKMHNAKIGKKLSPEHIEKIRQGKLGSKYPEESNKKRAQTLKDKYAKEGRVSPHKGHKMSEESKKLISEYHKGKKLSEETRHKMSTTRQGMKYNKQK